MTETTDILLHMLWNLALTIVFETGIAVLLGVRKKQDILYIILVNCITNPLLNFTMLFNIFLFTSYQGVHAIVWVLFAFCEILVVLYEYRFFKKNL